MKQERNKKLFKDIIIYGIGNIGSRFLALLLIPFLAFFLERDEIGYYNLALTAILFLLPVATLQMRESTFRLLIDNDDSVYRKNILSTTFFIESGVFLLILLISFCVPFFFNIRYFGLIVASIYIYSFYEIYLQVVRVIYSSVKFALMGIITTFLTVVFSLTLFFVFDRGIEGLFIGNILARIVSVVIIELPRRNFVKSLSLKHIKKEYAKEVLKYCLPMLLTAVSFGVITSCGKFIVSDVLGLQDNGDLALSENFVTIILILGFTFYQAWQVTAVKNYREEDSPVFFSEVFNKYAILLSLLVIFISFGLRSFSFILIDDKYLQSIDIIFIYSVGAMLYCFALFLEITFQCTKQTSKILYSILTCAIITPVLSYIMILQFGLMGNVIALCISYAYLFIFRYFQTKKTLPISLNKEFFIALALLIISGLVFHFIHNKIIDYTVLSLTSILLLYFFYISRKYISKKN